MATMIKAYIGNQPVMVPKGVYVPGVSPTPTGPVANTNVPMIDAYIGGIKVQVPKGVRVPGASLSPQTGSTGGEKTDLTGITYKDGTPVEPEGLAYLELVNKSDGLVSGKPISSEEGVNQLALDLAKQAELDVGASYDYMKYTDVEGLKNKMGDIRMAAAYYTQEENLSYKQKLQNTKEQIEAAGGTWSSRAKQALGQAGAQKTDIEGTIPQERRQNWERASNTWKTNMRDVGRAAELRYGSQALGEYNFGDYADPYAKGRNYDPNSRGAVYSPKNISPDGTPQADYIRSGNQTQYATGPNRRFASTYDIERQAAIERERNSRMSTRGYAPYSN